MAKDKLSFILGVHCHQPVGNFGWVIEEAFEKSYRPFMETLAQYPLLKATAHFSGPLLEWIEAERPEFFKTVRRLVEARQLEIIGGGFYEPILMTIPEIDRLEQIEMLSAYSEEKLGMRPSGLWLTERIWEPALPQTLTAAGVQFTFTDDSHFFQAGIPEEKVGGYYISEDQGEACAIFPIDQTLRYAVPFKAPEVTIEYLRKRFENGDRSCCTLFDDGEKFGLWPGTYNLLYRENWIKQFFEALQSESDWLEITTPSEYLRNNPSEGLVYMPTTSYFEMSQWTLNHEDNRTLEQLSHMHEEELGHKREVFIKGGFFRNFFLRYPESNHMHKRMLEVSRKVHLSGLEGQPRDEAKRELYQAQCNCAYWHGIFGGLYLPHLRDAIYEHLIKADFMTENRDLATDNYDLDYDGKPEIRLFSQWLIGLLSPFDGGTLIELDVAEPSFNLINTLARRPEAYHFPPVIQHEAGESTSIHDLEKQLTDEQRKQLLYDSTRRSCFRDTMLPIDQSPTAEDLRDLRYVDLGELATLNYTGVDSETSNEVIAEMSAKATLPDSSELNIVKRFALPKNRARMAVTYELTPANGKAIAGRFATQLNIALPAALGQTSPFIVDGNLLEGVGLLESGEKQAAKQFVIHETEHRHVDFQVDIDRDMDIIWHPIETVSQSESGFDRNYQSTAIWLLMPQTSIAEKTTFTVYLTIQDNQEKAHKAGDTSCAND